MNTPAHARDSKKRLAVGIVGSGGMLGSDLAEFFRRTCEVTGIKRKTYAEHRGKEFDVLINADGNSKRFWANEHPYEDFEASAVSVYRTMFDFSFRTYVFVSSSDVYPDHGKPDATDERQIIDPRLLSSYGFHKFLGEQIVRHRSPRHLILRCSLLLGRALRKGPVFDALRGQSLFLSRESRLQMITTWAVAEVIKTLLEREAQGVFNVGGKGAVSFGDMERILRRPLSTREDAQQQVYETDVEKLSAAYSLKTSKEYLKEYLELGSARP